MTLPMGCKGKYRNDSGIGRWAQLGYLEKTLTFTHCPGRLSPSKEKLPSITRRLLKDDCIKNKKDVKLLKLPVLKNNRMTAHVPFLPTFIM